MSAQRGASWDYRLDHETRSLVGIQNGEDLAGWTPLHHLRFSADIILRELTRAFHEGAAA